MKYLTGQQALNLQCSLLTCGDWHTSALQWEKLDLRESRESLFGEYGIELNVKIPEHTETYSVANHLRALLDLLEQGFFALTQGMKEDFICNDSYTNELFEMVIKMRILDNWTLIDRFMDKEYRSVWFKYKEENNYG